MKLYKRGTFGSPPLDGWLEASPAEILEAARPHADLERASLEFLRQKLRHEAEGEKYRPHLIVQAALGAADDS